MGSSDGNIYIRIIVQVMIENTCSRIAPARMHMSAYGIERPGAVHDTRNSRTPLENSVASLLKMRGKISIIAGWATSGCIERYGMASIRILPEMYSAP